MTSHCGRAVSSSIPIQGNLPYWKLPSSGSFFQDSDIETFSSLMEEPPLHALSLGEDPSSRRVATATLRYVLLRIRLTMNSIADSFESIGTPFGSPLSRAIISTIPLVAGTVYNHGSNSAGPVSPAGLIGGCIAAVVPRVLVRHRELCLP